jgi:hypothetical protein
LQNEKRKIIIIIIIIRRRRSKVKNVSSSLNTNTPYTKKSTTNYKPIRLF